MKTLRIIVIVLIILIMIPVTSFVIWNFRASTPLNILVMNKTVLELEKKEHRAIFWLLLNEKYVRDDNKVYRMDRDYFGFHPNKPLKSREYEVRRIRLEETDRLAEQYDMAYFSDTYGVFFNDWYRRNTDQGRGTLIEGGLNNSDYVFLNRMQELGKLIVAEYNFLAPPTIGLVRKKTEEMLDITWSNWTGSYIHNLDADRSRDLPAEIVNVYRKRNNGEWPFEGPGIVLFNELAQQVVVLEAEKHLDYPVPEIQATGYGSEQYDIPDLVHYPHWFDIMDPGDNQTIADYKIHVTIEGKALLDEYGLNSRFPAIIHSASGSPFIYLAGNYSNYHVHMWTAKLAGIRTFENIFYTNRDQDASKFYWTFYVPFMSQVLEEYAASLSN